MRLTCGLAIALWLSFPPAGMASWQQDATGSANSAEQIPTTPAGPEKEPGETEPAQNAPAAKPPTEPAPAEQVPSETAPAAPANPQIPAADEKAPGSVAKEKTDGGSSSAASPSGASPSRSRRRRKRTALAPDGTPWKIVVREGGAKEPAAQIAPGMTPAEATRQRQDAEQLLGSAADKLKRLVGHTLDAPQQETVAQIRNYMDGARSALKEGDVRRANTLALKAHLLSEELVKD